MTRDRRWGFRARLTVLIAAVFIVSGLALLVVQYLLVRRLFAQQIGSISTGCLVSESIHSTSSDDLTCSIESVPGAVDGEIIVGTDTSSVVIQQTTQLSEDVLSGLLMWSIAVLVLFACVAVIAAWWLSQKSLGRIARITERTRDITSHDLHRRLDLTGPADEIKVLADTIDEMLNRLHESFERQDRFIAGASHELRTPLTTTRTLLEIPLEQGRIPPELEDNVRGALTANQRSEQVVAALLALARSTHAPDLNADPKCDLNAVVRESLAEHSSNLSDRTLLVEGLPAHPIVVEADTSLTRIVVGNLVENAFLHSLDRGTVAINARVSENAVQLTIENTGRPLTDAEVSRLTEPFYRGQETRLTGQGTGLGLTLADTIAHSLGATLALSARDGGGLVAELRIPTVRGGERS